jgi:enoyl-CoA hydratase/carnithine racemase
MAFIHLIRKEDFAVIQMDRDKANPMNQSFVSELRSVLKECLSDDAIKGVIINGKENFFSAGLDLPELYHYTEQEFSVFWKDFMGLVCDLVSFDKPLVASITGHAPAGGCIIAIGCDYRVMAEGNYKIGLNEIPVGIIVPRGVFDIYSYWIGRGRAFNYLMEGKLYSPEHAKEIGLVDEIVAPSAVLETAENKLRHYLKFEQGGWRMTKRQLKQQQYTSISSITDAEMNMFLQQWWSQPVRAVIGKFVEQLKKK